MGSDRRVTKSTGDAKNLKHTQEGARGKHCLSKGPHNHYPAVRIKNIHQKIGEILAKDRDVVSNFDGERRNQTQNHRRS